MATEKKTQAEPAPSPPPAESPPGHNFEAGDRCAIGPLEQLLESRSASQVGELLGLSTSTIRKRLREKELTKEAFIACNALLERMKPEVPAKVVIVAIMTESEADNLAKMMAAFELPPPRKIRLDGNPNA